MTALWTIDELAKAAGGRLSGGSFPPVTGFSIDTRSLKPGDVFVALTGEKSDGHAYVADALKKGAAAAMIAADRLSTLDPAGRYILVEAPLKALEKIAAAARARTRARIVAVTGSVGKTGTKEALRLALSPTGATHAAQASFNNHIGVPLTLAALPPEHAFGVFEIGMNHAGEITPLSRLVRPHVAIVTTVGEAHLEFFDSVEGIAEAKAEIFLGLEKGGHALINRDNAHYELLARRAREAGANVVYFGEHPESSVRLLDLHADHRGSVVEASILGQAATYRIGAPGRHIVQNSLAVLGAVSLLGADLALAALSFARLAAPKGRGERLVFALPRGETFTLIDESYNANPSSMAAAFALLGASKPRRGGRRIAVLGDMLELGEASAELHRGLVTPLSAAKVDMVFTAGAMMEELARNLPPGMRGRHAMSAAELEPAVLAAPQPGDVIMVKGSNGSRVGAIVEAFKTRYPPADADEGADEA